METMIQAGFGRGTIYFPESIFPLEGFSGVHDAPHVRLMVLKFQNSAFALLEAELVIVPLTSIDLWRDKIAATFSIPREQTVVQMTHTFTTPHEPGPLGPPDRRPEPTEEDLRKRAIYHEVTDRAVDESIQQAKVNFGSAVLGWGEGTCEVNVNCDVETPFGWWLGNDPDGYSNHSMTVLRCDDDSGKLKGILVSFGMKPSAIDNAGRKENQRQISSEICGAFCNKMETAFGVPVIYAVSAGGNQVPCKSAFRHQVDAQGEVLEIDEGVAQGLAYADELSDEMCAACAGIVKEIRCQESVLDGKWSDCSMPWTRRRGGPRKLTPKVTHTAEGETAITADLFQMGATTFVMVRPEMTAECERLLRAENPNHRVILMTLANGEMKCLPDQSSFEKGTYEAQGSNLMPGAAEMLIRIVSEKIRNMTQ